MKCLFNASTLWEGGVLQVALSMIQEAQSDSDTEWTYLLSSSMEREVQRSRIDLSGRQYIVPRSPARSLSARRYVRQLELSLLPEFVFTLFGPAYVPFRAPHLMGVADAWITNPTPLAYKCLRSPLKMIARKCLVAYRSRHLAVADAWHTETETAKAGLSRVLARLSGQPANFLAERVHVIPNTCGNHYLRFIENEGVLRRAPDDRYVILTLAAPHPSKRLEIIPDVAHKLLNLQPAKPPLFVVTIHPEHAMWQRMAKRAEYLGVSDAIVNRGVVPVEDGPGLYASAHVSFFPSVLETYSATSIEAMCMGVPIVTTDLPFSREACGSAARYFRPDSIDEAAQALYDALHSHELRWHLTEGGAQMFARRYVSPADRYQAYVDAIRSLYPIYERR